MPTRVCLIAVLTALCLGTNYALIWLPNVKVMDFIVFLAGLNFGILVGAATGSLIWVVYGWINPYGVLSLPTWLLITFGQTMYGVVGGLLGRTTSWPLRRFSNNFKIELALLGFVLTFLYDLVSNIGFAVTYEIPLIYVLATGWLVPPWFGIIHEVSNAILFSLATCPSIKAINGLLGGEEHVYEK